MPISTHTFMTLFMLYIVISVRVQSCCMLLRSPARRLFWSFIAEMEVCQHLCKCDAVILGILTYIHIIYIISP